MNTVDLFSKWAKKAEIPITNVKDKRAVVYTRVSTKEQSDKNLSLDWQKKTIDEFSQRNGFTISDYFGGTFESAKTDGRKEFQRMLDLIRKKKGQITHILVYLLDRFSRTGGGAIKLAKDLREKYGVTIIAVTQPIDTSNPGGVFQQNMQFLFSEYDNQLRRQRAMAGIKEKLERGIWCKKPPIGYDVIRTNGERKIVVNNLGKKLKKAFEWKAQGMKNDEILQRLKAIGVKIYKQKLSMTFSNPFYCGIISVRTLNGRLVEGLHEKLITQELFLQVNNIRNQAGGKIGVTHKKEREEIPLKMFIKCHKCGQPYTGFIVKKKKIFYYKCRNIGCCCNRNARILNGQFVNHLSSYTVKSDHILPLIYAMSNLFEKYGVSCLEQERALKSNLNAIQEKIDTIEEKYYLSDSGMTRETYDKLMAKLINEKQGILESMANSTEQISNLKKYYETGVSISSKLATGWTSREVSVKEKLQNLVFPEGIVYDFDNQRFQTPKTNELFQLIADLNCISEDDINKQGGIKATLSSLVGKTGFEPATPWSQTRCATGLRYFPFLIHLEGITKLPVLKNYCPKTVPIQRRGRDSNPRYKFKLV